MAPELGLTQPGMTIVCGDNHTATHGVRRTRVRGLEVGHVLATQCLLQRKPKTMRVLVEAASARFREGSHARHHRRHGFGGGSGHVVEYAGEAIRGLDGGRMTLCNMSIEAGARPA